MKELRKKPRKVISTIIIGLIIVCYVVVSLIIPINASNAYITTGDDLSSFERTYVNGQINFGTINRRIIGENTDKNGTKQQIYDENVLWVGSQITESIIYPNMDTFEDNDIFGEGASMGYNLGISKTNNFSGLAKLAPKTKEYNNVKWGNEIIDKTYVTDWSQSGVIILYDGTRLDDKTGETGERITGIYDVYIEIQDVLCYGENLRKNKEYTGENCSIQTKFEIDLDNVITNWENMKNDQIMEYFNHVDYRQGVGEEDYYVATNIATGETRKEKFVITRSIDREEGTITFGINMPEFDDNDIWTISGKKTLMIRQENEVENFGILEIDFEHHYSCLKDSENIKRLLIEKSRVELPDIVRLGGWLGTAVGGFMDAEFYQGVTIGGIFVMIIGFAMVIWLIKLFAGG